VIKTVDDFISLRRRKEIARKFADAGFLITRSALYKIFELNLDEFAIESLIDALTKNLYPKKILNDSDILTILNKGKEHPPTQKAAEFVEEAIEKTIEPPEKSSEDLSTKDVEKFSVGFQKASEIIGKIPESSKEVISKPSEEVSENVLKESSPTTDFDTFSEEEQVSEKFGEPEVLMAGPERGEVTIEIRHDEAEGVTAEISDIVTERLSLERKSILLKESIVEEPIEKIVSTEVSKDVFEEKIYEITPRKRKLREEYDIKYEFIHFNPSKIYSQGIEEDFISLFRSRYEKLSKYIIEKIRAKKMLNPKLKDVRLVSSSEVGRHINNYVAIIGIVNEFRANSKKEGYIAVIFDQDGEVTAYIKKDKGDVVLYPGEVVGLIGKVRKTSRGALLFVEGKDYVIFPELKARRNINEEAVRELPEFEIVFTSDIHVGSKYFLEDAFRKFIKWLNTSEEAERVKFLIIPGDLVDGVGVYPNQERELLITDVYKQYEKLIELLGEIDTSIEIIITPGNHDIVRLSLPQPPIPKEILSPSSGNIKSWTNPMAIKIEDVARILTLHGVPLEDVIATVPGLSHEKPVEAMKILLEKRHLAPCYGERTPIQPLSQDLLVIEDEIAPDIFVTGHVHRLDYELFKGILIINDSAWQSQTPYQKTHGINPIPTHIVKVSLRRLLLGEENYASEKGFGE